MRCSNWFLWVGFVVFLGGCAGEANTGSNDGPSSNAWSQGKGASEVDGGTSEVEQPADALEERQVHPVPLLPSAGWLDKAGSAVYPWCAAVLVAPRVVLTGATCAQSDISDLVFGVGTPGGVGVPVVDSLHLVGDHRVAALLLGEAVEQVDPAALASPTDRDGGLGDGIAVTSVSMRYAERGSASERWGWSGVLHAGEELQVGVGSADASESELGEAREPSCHGDNGAGVYTEDGLLAGIVVAASGEGICADTFTLSPLAARGLVDEALAAFGF